MSLVDDDGDRGAERSLLEPPHLGSNHGTASHEMLWAGATLSRQREPGDEYTSTRKELPLARVTRAICTVSTRTIELRIEPEERTSAPLSFHVCATS